MSYFTTVYERKKCKECNALTHIRYHELGIRKFRKIPKVKVLKRVGLNEKVYLKSGRTLSPFFIIAFGDYIFAYWEKKQLAKTIILCSRKCAITYSKKNNVILRNKILSTSMIVPQTEYFDDYAQENNLTEYLSTMHDGDTYIEHLKKYIDGKLKITEDYSRESFDKIHYEHLYILCIIAIEKDYSSIARKALKKLANTKLHIIIKYLFFIQLLMDLKEYEEIERIFTIFDKKGFIDKNIFSCAALYLSRINNKKALYFSQKALSIASEDPIVITNHLAALSASKFANEIKITFIFNNLHLFNSEAAYFNSAKILYNAEEYEKSLEFFKISDNINPNFESKLFIAKTSLQLNDYNNALLYSQLAFKQLIPSKAIDNYSFQGNEIMFWNFIPTDNLGSQKTLLIIEGKSLYNLGEYDEAKEKINTALKINSEIDQELLLGIEEIIGDDKTTNNNEIPSSALLKLNKMKEHLTIEMKKVDTLNEILDAIASINNQWGNTLDAIKDDIDKSALNEDFSQRIHALTVLMRNHKQTSYKDFYKKTKSKYSYLQAEIIEQLSNAVFILNDLGNSLKDIPVYTGSVIELSKAIETTVNLILISPYIEYLKKERIEFGKLDWIISKKSKRLMLGQITSFLSTSNSDFIKYVQNHFPEFSHWILNKLLIILDKVRNEYRNGSAHNSNVSLLKANEFFKYIHDVEFFEIFNALAKNDFSN